MEIRLFLLLIVISGLADGFYLPGVAPTDFNKGDLIEVRAIKMTSVHTQLPFGYYSLPFCQPSAGIEYKSRNLGEILRGDRLVNTAYRIQMDKAVQCGLVCPDGGGVTWKADVMADLLARIKHEYFVHLIIDNLPCATQFRQLSNPTIVQYEPGFRLGYTKNGRSFVNNHLTFKLSYHKYSTTDADVADLYRVVGFRVEPKSIDVDSYTVLEDGISCTIAPEYASQTVLIERDSQLIFSYSVEWEASDIRWASRWDIYLSMADVQIHWFSIINSVVVVFFLSGVITLIIIRTLRRDIARYNTSSLEEDIGDYIEETGWKLVHGDVFRPPQNSRLFAALVTSGVQIYCMLGITIFFAMLGMLSPTSRGAILTTAIFLYEFMGLLAGYVGGRLYKTMKGISWPKVAFMSAVLYPGIMFGLGFFINFFIWGQHSSGAVPFLTMLGMGGMWFGISLPLIYIGYYMGFNKKPYSFPVKINQIPRQVPSTNAWFLHLIPASLLSGILPFGACFIELFFVFSAIYENQFYYLFGFLFIVFLILVISCSQISIVIVYLQLCSENYNWWWRSFIISGGGSAFYVMLYSIFYFFTKLEIDEFVPTLLYFTYSIMMAVTFWFLTGTIGFLAAFLFVRKIYAEIKIE